MLILEDTELFPQFLDFISRGRLSLSWLILLVLPPAPGAVKGGLGCKFVNQFLLTFAAINIFLEKGLILLGKFFILGLQSLGF